MIDGRRCRYLGSEMSYTEWGCRVRGWSAIQIYVHPETMDCELLQSLRQKLAARS